MFALEEQRCTITNVNPRSERHGDDNVIGCDITLRAEATCDILDEFARGLKDAFYRQAPLDSDALIPGGVVSPELRYEGMLEPLRFKKDYAGYVMQIVWGDLAGSVDLSIEGCRVHKFSIDPKQGGTCLLTLQVQSHPDSPTMGDLCALIEREVTVTLTPPPFEIRKDETETEDVA